MRFLRKSFGLGCAVMFTALGLNGANAALVQSFDSGWYTNSGFTAGVNNINVGSSNLNGAIYNNWLAFNLGSLAGQTVSSATLTFYGSNGTNTSTTTETLGLFDYTGSINSLIANTQSTAIFTDLGSGQSYGTADVAPGPIAQFTVVLSQAAISGINAALQNSSDNRFVIGGSLQTVSGPFANEQLFAIFGPAAAQNPAAALDVQVAAVPEPSAWALMILGFGAVGTACRRRPKLQSQLRLA